MPLCVLKLEVGRFGILGFCGGKRNLPSTPNHTRVEDVQIQRMFKCRVLNNNKINEWSLQYSWGITPNQSRRTETRHMGIKKRDQVVSQFGRVKRHRVKQRGVTSRLEHMKSRWIYKHFEGLILWTCGPSVCGSLRRVASMLCLCPSTEGTKLPSPPADSSVFYRGLQNPEQTHNPLPWTITFGTW